MVNPDILNYLLDGRKRGFGLAMLKRKLLEGGFDAVDIDEAIMALPVEKMESKLLQTTSQPTIKQSLPSAQTTASPQEKLSFFKKIGYSISNPRRVFEKTDEASVGRTLPLHELLLLIPLAFLILINALFISFLAPFAPMYSSIIFFVIPSTYTLLLVGISIALSFVVAPLFVLLIAGVTHLFVILMKGQGGYKGTYKGILYGVVPGCMLSPLITLISLVAYSSPFTTLFSIGLFIWTIVLTI
ncbi:MAG: Yip1 family protein, partial [Nanoarchaeota archaeon]